jgi:hypothetical protein
MFVIIREALLKGKAQYKWPPCTKQFRQAAFNTKIFFPILQNKLLKQGGQSYRAFSLNKGSLVLTDLSDSPTSGRTANQPKLFAVSFFVFVKMSCRSKVKEVELFRAKTFLSNFPRIDSNQTTFDSATTFGIMTTSLMTLSIITPCILNIIGSLSLNDIQHNDTLHTNWM